MDQNFASLAVATLPLQRPAINGNVVLQAILHLQKLNGCSVNNLKKYLASQHGIDCQALDAVIKPIMKMAMDRNILKNLGDTEKVAECKRRKKSSGGGKKRRKSSGGSKKRRKSSVGKKRKKSSGGKRRRRKSKKGTAAAE
ncbi:hypothetical protein AVEN_213680-1 [Araneus ventricosus]|uniref:H15 domain-containing protein n=1 Tax=Araneus ventricosus TaxID=182803 RepID=A0A4Y2IVD8_ARAVE|nr:hypothetical protein AVEN_226157-1 [Araneus ventricosus]GBM80901.1 hypothetical protein AVEN_23097-1 [Araneus ventricosus]GBM80918.1 hypothetical protein AVEN_171961-1 [Araneus ventricosus]GBM80933.1 hypothetical protein AVEN_213680-1 [Araneus ventricosus]